MDLGITKKQWAILASLIIFFGVVIIFGVSGYEKKQQDVLVENKNPLPGEVTATGPNRVEFTPEIPTNATATIPEAKYAVGGAENSFGVYDIVISKKGFSKNDLTVKKGDFVKMKVSATDGDYDFSIPQYGTYLVVKAGEVKQVTFVPDAIGTFLFECRDKCPSGQKISGRFIVLPK